MVAALICGGAAVCLLLCHLVKGGRFLEIVLLAAYGLRVALAVSLYAISAYHLPLFQALQLGDGFWLFARDAPWYHWNAIQIAEALRWRTEIPSLTVGGQVFMVEPDFYLAIASVYRILGDHPLYIPLLNALLWSAISILAYLLARRISGEGAGRTAALVVSIWPSPYIWSSQILKDTLVIFLLLSTLFLCVHILGGRGSLWFATILPLAAVLFALARFRVYLVPILALAIGGAVVSCLIRWSPLWGKAVRGLLLLGVLFPIFFFARTVNPADLLTPARPEIGHWRKAEYLSAQGDHAAALEEYRRALEINPRLVDPQLRVSKQSTQPHSGSAGASQMESRPQKVSRRSPWRGFGYLRKIEYQMEEAGYEPQPENRIVAMFSKIYSVNRLARARRGFSGERGASNVGDDVRFDGIRSIVAYVPRGLSYALFAPLPWQLFSPAGDTGAFKLLSGVEMLLIFATVPFFAVGITRAARSGFPEVWLLLIFGAVAATLLGLVVTNIGILFRLRLQFLIPMFVILAAYGGGDLRRVAARLVPAQWLRQRG